MKQTEQLMKEREAMHQQIEQLQSEVTHFKPMQENYNRIRSQVSSDSHQRIQMRKCFFSQYKQMEALKSKAQDMISPLRAKVIRLADLCKEKVSVASSRNVFLINVTDRMSSFPNWLMSSLSCRRSKAPLQLLF
jgi:cell division septum initiation protein DivIVA